ncbi:MAG TPA: 3-isopropylmalate dehydrogenase [Casimicrobiaceae bacterium]|nr:3-isopropylmalate dehydrogenase [Casimicrobiaceae bacterium]
MKIAVLAGDGIGTEVTAQAVNVLRAAVGNRSPLELVDAEVGGVALERHGDPLPPHTLDIARKSDAILFGSAGVPGDEKLPYDKRPGASLLRLRKDLALFANFRPAFLFPELADASTMKPAAIEGLDLMILRELTGDLYFGEPRGFGTNASGDREAFNTMRYSEPEVERIAHVAFRTARSRRRKLCSVDKANVLEVMQLWRDVVSRVGREYQDVELTHLFVDAAVMQLMRAPTQFDVIVTGNVFGDILSDAAAMLTGSIGMLPSASLAHDRKGLYEPVHGSAPDIAGRDLANPIAAILSAAMMLRYSFDRADLADEIERAVRSALAHGYRTADIFKPGNKRVGTADMGGAIIEALRARR